MKNDWRQRNGEYINVKDMTDLHIQNSIDMMERWLTSRYGNEELIEVWTSDPDQLGSNTEIIPYSRQQYLDKVFIGASNVYKERARRFKKMVNK